MQVTISFEKPAHMKTGGLAQKAAEVRDAGRHGDTVLVHVNPEEFAFLKKTFGPGSTNPQTGLPQFNIWDVLLPVAANIFLPGIGGAIGSALTGALGIGANLAPLIGGAIVGGGISSLTGGDVGTGIVSGGLAPSVLSTLGLTGSGGALSGLNLLPAAAAAATPAAAAPAAAAAAPTAAATGAAAAGAASPTLASSLLKAAPLLLAASALGGAGRSNQPSGPPELDSSQKSKTPLTPVKFERPQLQPQVTTRYGYGPEQQFFQNNVLPAAEGRYVKGGGTGTSDDIPARLSDGEYVLDASTVSMLGDGSSDAGAKKLDEMRENIRKHKGAALAKGKFAPDAKGPLSYIKGA